MRVSGDDEGKFGDNYEVELTEDRVMLRIHLLVIRVSLMMITRERLVMKRVSSVVMRVKCCVKFDMACHHIMCNKEKKKTKSNLNVICNLFLEVISLGNNQCYVHRSKMRQGYI